MNMKQLLMSADVVARLTAMDADGTLAKFEPTLAALRMPIPKGYHHKDNLTHSIKVLENAIAREVDGPDLILRTAALFHDIGKPATRKFEGKGVVTFTNHDYIGGRIVAKVLRGHGYTKAEIAEVVKLVEMHMRSHSFDANVQPGSAARRVITDAGNQTTLDRLFVLFYSDITTANAAKRDRFHKNIDLLRKAVKEVKAKDARAALRPAVNGNEVMERYNMKPGRELGAIMKFLNSDEGIKLSREEAFQAIEAKFLNQ